jgi:hypothetical protein
MLDNILWGVWGAIGLGVLYEVVTTLYRKFLGRANIHIAAANFSRSGRIEKED